MRPAVAVGLAFFHAGLTVAWGGVDPGRNGPWWVFAPFVVTFGAGLLAEGVTAVLPRPWSEGRRYGPPPRAVQLTWKTALRLPALAPPLVFLYYLYRALSLHFQILWVACLVAIVSATAVALLARKRRGELRLLRRGEVALGLVDARTDVGEGPERVAFHFTTEGGEAVSGRGWDLGYGVAEGARVPVFYDAADPRDNVLACACWFEADRDEGAAIPAQASSRARRRSLRGWACGPRARSRS